jgi:CIC family chloride channel protein
VLRLGYKEKTLLIGCGAAGAMASIFTTPVAAVVFAFEVLLLDLSSASLIPLLFASVTGAVTTKLLTSEQYLVHFKVSEHFLLQDIPFFVILGLITGFVSVYFHFMHFTIIRWFSKIPSRWVRWLIGSSLLGVLIYFLPPLFGEGYNSIRYIVSGNPGDLLNYTLFSGSDYIWTLIGFTIFLVLFKVIATTLTTEAGGVGGIFAPAAVMGGFTGFVISTGINTLFKGTGLHVSNFTLVGMASVLGGVLLAPLTAIFLIAEMSNGYELIVPLMLSTSIAYLIARTFNKHSIFTQTLAERGEMYQFKDTAVLKQLRIKDLLEKDVIRVSINSSLGDLTSDIKRSRRNQFAIVDEHNTFLGIVSLDDVREDMFNRDKWDEPVSNYLYSLMDDEKVSVSNDVQEVINKFNRTGNYNLVVLDGNKYAGMISRANVLKAYRESMLADVGDF